MTKAELYDELHRIHRELSPSELAELTDKYYIQGRSMRFRRKNIFSHLYRWLAHRSIGWKLRAALCFRSKVLSRIDSWIISRADWKVSDAKDLWAVSPRKFRKYFKTQAKATRYMSKEKAAIYIRDKYLDWLDNRPVNSWFDTSGLPWMM